MSLLHHTVQVYKEQQNDRNYAETEGNDMVQSFGLHSGCFLHLFIDSVFSQSAFCHSYYGLSVWFPDMIKHLQYEEYESRVMVR